MQYVKIKLLNWSKIARKIALKIIYYMVVQLIIFPSIFNLNGMHHGAASVIKNADFCVIKYAYQNPDAVLL